MGNNLRDASGGITSRFDDKRQFAYLLMHTRSFLPVEPIGQFLIFSFSYYDVVFMFSYF